MCSALLVGIFWKRALACRKANKQRCSSRWVKSYDGNGILTVLRNNLVQFDDLAEKLKTHFCSGNLPAAWSGINRPRYANPKRPIGKLINFATTNLMISINSFQKLKTFNLKWNQKPIVYKYLRCLWDIWHGIQVSKTTTSSFFLGSEKAIQLQRKVLYFRRSLRKSENLILRKIEWEVIWSLIALLIISFTLVIYIRPGERAEHLGTKLQQFLGMY